MKIVIGQGQERWTRREVIKRFASGAAAIAIAGAVGGGGFSAPVSAESVYYKATTALNLRSQANTTSAVILVIPQGGQVMQVGPDLNGFKKVSYSGKTGYASAKYLVLANEGGGGTDTPAYIGLATTTASVNMRAGAGTNFSVLKVIPKGASVETYDKVASSFRLVRYQGQFGYVHSSYLTQGGGAPVVTMTAIQMLAVWENPPQPPPALLGRTITIIPAGAQVTVLSDIVYGQRKVQYGNITGWVYAIYLK